MFEENRLYKFGATTIARVSNSDELKQLLVDPLFDSKTLIIKPNWISTDPAAFNDAESMRLIFEALDARIVVVESYCLSRSLNIHPRGKEFTVGDKTVDWKWLLKGSGWTWLTTHPDWEWFKREGHWDQIREEEQAFLDKYGFTDLFKEFGVSYVNVTEEVWSGRIADPAEIKRSVEARFKPVQCEQLYSLVPSALYDLRGSPFISLARLKNYASFSFKNLFGMIPDPLRSWWHGPGDNIVTTNIIDINKVYHALFPMYGICEGLKTMAYADPQGKYKDTFTGRYSVADGCGAIALGRDLLSLDSILLSLSDPVGRKAEQNVNIAPIDQAETEFGAVDRRAVAEAVATIKDRSWLSPSPSS